MNTLVSELSSWLPLAGLVIYLILQSRWDAYSRKKAYEELKQLNDLRTQGILTQEEFDEKKEALLSI